MTDKKNRVFHDFPFGWVKRALIHFKVNSTSVIYNWLHFKRKSFSNYRKHLALLEFLRKDMLRNGMSEELVEKKIALLKKEYEG